MSLFPFDMKIPSQNLVRRFANLEQLSKFIETEASFFRQTAELVSANFNLNGRNFGTLQLSNQAARFFEELKRAIGRDEREPLDGYIERAQNLQILVAQGCIGQRAQELIANDAQRQDGRWIVILLCSEWIDGEVHSHIAPYRAAFLANPTLASYGDLISASDALDRSKMAAASVEQAQHELDAFIREKTSLFENLEELYRNKLTLDEPAHTWKKIAARKTKVWSAWLAIFAALVAAPIILAVWDWPSVSEAILKLTAGANGTFSVAGLAIVTVPALFYAWLLKNVSRVFIQNLNLADDAYHRRSLALTYLGLLQNDKHPASDQDRAIILNALFRPIPPQTADEGPPAGVLELIRGKA